METPNQQQQAGDGPEVSHKEPLRPRAEIIGEIVEAIVSGNASLDGDDSLRPMLNNLAEAEYERGFRSAVG